MASLDTLVKSLETKLQMLKFTNEGVKETLQKKHVPSMERKAKTLQDKIDEVHELETKIQEARIEKGDGVESIREWTDEIEKGLQVFEQSGLEITEAVSELNRSKVEQKKQEEEELSTQLRQKKFEEEMKFEEVKLQQKLEYEKKAQQGLKKLEKDSSKLHTKLSKLVITKFKGVQTDWLRF